MNHVPQNVALIALACVLLGTSPCCSRSEGPGVPAKIGGTDAKVGKTKVATETYRLVGIVKSSNKETGLVNIRHDAIAGFMQAMTMPFTVKDRKTLNDLYPGDEVEGTLRVDKENGIVKDYELVDLVVTRQADQPPGAEKNVATTPSLPLLQTGELVPDFAMTDQEGRSLKLSDLRGFVVGLTFVYTSCPLPNFCPMLDQRFHDLAEQIGHVSSKASKTRLLSVSFDPDHDTTDILAKHAAIRGAKPPLWRFAVATHPELAKVGPRLGLSYAPTSREIIHNLSIALIDPDGKLIALQTGNEARDWTPAEMAKVIYKHLAH